MSTGRSRSKDEEGHVVLKKAPLEVGSYLQETLWIQLPAAVLTSATLATGSLIQYQEMLALEGAGEAHPRLALQHRNRPGCASPKDSRGLDVNSLPFGDYIAEKVLRSPG